MYEDLRSKSTTELRATIERIKRRAKTMSEEYRQAEKSEDPHIDLNERNQEIVEQYMFIKMIEQLIADRRGLEYDRQPAIVEKPLSSQDIKRHYQSGIKHIKQGHYPLAIDDFNIVLHRENTNADAYYYRGI